MSARSEVFLAFTVVLCLALTIACGHKETIDGFFVEGPIAGSEFEQASSPAITVSPGGEYVVFLLHRNQEDGLGLDVVAIDRSSKKVTRARAGECATTLQSLVWPYAWLSDDRFVLQMLDGSSTAFHVPTLASEKRYQADLNGLVGPGGVSRGELGRLAQEGGHSDETKKVSHVHTDLGLVTYFSGTAGMRIGTGKSKTTDGNAIYRRSPAGELTVVTRYWHLFYEARCASLSASPDNRFLVYEWCVEVKGNPVQFGCRTPKYIVSLETGERRKLAELAGTANIVWTPDSKEAYFVGYENGRGGLYAVRHEAMRDDPDVKQ